MATTTNLTTLKINYLTQAQYDTAKTNNQINPNELYLTPHDDNYFLNLIYPVGAIYISTVSTSPATLFGGTWEQIQDTFLLAAGSTYSAGGTGGSATHTHTTGDHTLTAAESGLPGHGHTYTGPTVSSSGAVTGGITGGSHSHAPTDTSDSKTQYYVVSEASGAYNIAPTTGGTTSRRIDAPAATEAIFHHIATTKATTHTHNLPNHTHTLTGGSVANATAANASSAHNHGNTGSSSNMPPYLAVYVWKRTA